MVPPDPHTELRSETPMRHGSVGFPHVRVGHRQVLNVNPELKSLGFLFYGFLFMDFLLYLNLIKLKCGRKLVCFYVKNI